MIFQTFSQHLSGILSMFPIAALKSAFKRSWHTPTLVATKHCGLISGNRIEKPRSEMFPLREWLDLWIAHALL